MTFIKNEINILHLSDLHFGVEDMGGLGREAVERREETLLEFKKSLRNIEDKWNPNIIAISGDIGWAGRKENYVEAWEFIEELLDEFQLSSKHIILCSGNHDRNLDHSKCLPVPDSPNDVDLLFENNLQDLEEPFSEFIQFSKAHNLEQLMFGDNNNYLVGFRELYNLRFAIINSAWFSNGGHGDLGKLFIGNPIIRKLKLAKQLADKANYNNEPTTITLLHHPPNWLHHC